MADPTDALFTVHVVDDDGGMRDSLRVLLDAAGFAVETHVSAQDFLSTAHGSSGCVLSDLRMPGIDGLELQRRLRESGVNLPMILMTAHGAVGLAVRGMKAGAIDFLEKPFATDALLAAVKRARERSWRQEARASVAAEAAARVATLTRREREVLELLVAGFSTKAIARTLQASPRTIDVHRARVFSKLQVASLPELVRLAMAADPKNEADES